jgi:hypothetical protein
MHFYYSYFSSPLFSSNTGKGKVMAEEEPKPLAYIPEIILKKRKSNEEWALKRKAQYEERNSLARKRAKHDFIRMPEDFIKEYRTRVTISIHMKYLLISVCVCVFLLLENIDTRFRLSWVVVEIGKYDF